MQAIRILIDAAKAYYEEMLLFLLTSLILLVTVPLIIPMPFALIGVWMIAHRSVRGLGVNWGLYWQAVKEYGFKSLQLTLVLILGYVLLLSNIWFYNTPEVSPLPAHVAGWLLPLWVFLGIVWIGVTFYAHAFLIELKEPKLLMILRSSLALTFVNPVTTLLLILAIVLLTALSIVLPLLLFALPGFIATLSITAVRKLIGVIHEKYGSTETAQADEPRSTNDAEDDAAEADPA